jgi:hypothetical protein
VGLKDGDTIEQFRIAVREYAEKDGVGKYTPASLLVYPPGTAIPPPPEATNMSFNTRLADLQLRDSDILLVVASVSSIHQEVISLNGVYIGAPWTLARSEVIQKIQDKLQYGRKLLLNAPPASGKTSLLDLLETKLAQEFEIV